MKAIGLGLLGVVLWCGVSEAWAQGDLPPAALEVLKQFEGELVDIDKKTEAEVVALRDKTAAELKKIQDLLCKEAKLDEAVAVRDLIRSLQAGTNAAPGSDLPPAAKEVYQQHEQELAEIHKKAEAEFVKRRDRMAAELKKVQDLFCKEAKLDEAVAVRDLIRALHDGVTKGLPDPGYVNNPATDIGKVLYYEVTGVTTGGSIYGTEVFTTGSHLAMAAVHSGVMKNGQRGIVKVTILPGQTNYPASTRHGITSHSWGAYGVSFKVERVYGFVGKLPALTLPGRGS